MTYDLDPPAPEPVRDEVREHRAWVLRNEGARDEAAEALRGLSPEAMELIQDTIMFLSGRDVRLAGLAEDVRDGLHGDWKKLREAMSIEPLVRVWLERHPGRRIALTTSDKGAATSPDIRWFMRELEATIGPRTEHQVKTLLEHLGHGHGMKRTATQ